MFRFRARRPAFRAARLAAGLLLGLRAAAAEGQSRPATPPPQETYRVPLPGRHLRVLLRHESSAHSGPTRHGPVLFIHGSTLPSEASSALRLDGISWMDDLAGRGFDVWALDFLGYGGSDRYPEMAQPPSSHRPLGRVPELERQIDAAVQFIRQRTGAERVSLVAHSAGTMAAGGYAAHHPDRVARLVLYGPVTQRHAPGDTTPAAAYDLITAQDQINRFTGWVPRGEAQVIVPDHLRRLTATYIASDPASGRRTPPSVAAPAGMDADANEAWSGALPYDPAAITAPVLILRGEWDVVTTDADARWLFDALRRSPIRRDVKISRATHLMHLERARFQAYDETAGFLGESDDDVGRD